LAGILRATTGEHANAYARTRLFAPLGISGERWFTAPADGLPPPGGGRSPHRRRARAAFRAARPQRRALVHGAGGRPAAHGRRPVAEVARHGEAGRAGAARRRVERAAGRAGAVAPPPPAAPRG